MRGKGYTVISNKILNDSSLNIYEKYFIIALKSFDHKNIGEAYPTYETLMNLLGTSNRNTISNIISSLKNKKYIEVIKKDRVNCYKFIKDYLLDGRSNRLNTTTSNELDTSKSNSLDTTTSNSKNTSGVKKDENSNKNDTLNSNTNDTQKIKDKKEIYISVLKKWNEKNIANEIDLSSSIESDIEHALSKFCLDEIIQAINHYGEVYHSGFYYDHIWCLEGFLTSTNGVQKFIDNGQVWRSYLNRRREKVKIKASDYID